MDQISGDRLENEDLDLVRSATEFSYSGDAVAGCACHILLASSGVMFRLQLSQSRNIEEMSLSTFLATIQLLYIPLSRLGFVLICRWICQVSLKRLRQTFICTRQTEYRICSLSIEETLPMRSL
jgi:hypothetical protein